jgi:hypothetical protein
MTREKKIDNTSWALRRAVHRMARQQQLRKPLHRLLKHELPLCGARTRTGRPCQAPAWWDEDRCVPRNGRCRVHGGLSSGPRTPEGKRRIGEAARLRAQQKR